MPLPKPPTKKASLLVAADFDVAAAPRGDQNRQRAESDALVAEPELFETPARAAPVAASAPAIAKLTPAARPSAPVPAPPCR